MGLKLPSFQLKKMNLKSVGKVQTKFSFLMKVSAAINPKSNSITAYSISEASGATPAPLSKFRTANSFIPCTVQNMVIEMGSN